MKRTAKSLVDEAMVQVTTYTVEQRALHGHPGVQFVDIRDVRELEHEGVIRARCTPLRHADRTSGRP